MGKVQATVKIDSKCRIYIPEEMREGIGDTVTLKRTQKGILLVPSKHYDAVDELRKIVTSKHRRTGKPENWSPEKLKNTA